MPSVLYACPFISVSRSWPIWRVSKLPEIELAFRVHDHESQYHLDFGVGQMQEEGPGKTLYTQKGCLQS